MVSTGSVITDTGDLPAPSQGDAFRFHIKFDGTTDADSHASFGFAIQGENGGSSVSGFFAGIVEGDLGIFRVDSGTAQTATTATATISSGNWYEFEVIWGTDDSIEAKLLGDDGGNIITASTTDNTYTSGGVGWGYNLVSSSLFFDFARIL